MHKIEIIKNPDTDTLIQFKEIWMEAFHDTEEYVDFCFSHLPKDVDIVVAVDGKIILGALYLFPYIIKPGDFPAYYGYAGAIRSAYQGSGIFSDLISFMKVHYSNINVEIIGSAIEPELIKPYMRRGYTEIYECLEETIDCPRVTGEIDLPERSELTAAEWKSMRPHLEEGQYYMDPTGDCLNYIIEEKRFCGNIWEKVKIADSWYSIIGFFEDSTLVIEETSAPESLISKHAAGLCSAYKVIRLKVHFPPTKRNCSIPSIYNSQGTFEQGYLWTPLLMD